VTFIKNPLFLILSLLVALAGVTGCESGPGSQGGKGPRHRVSAKTEAKVKSKLQLVTKPVTLHLYTGGGDPEKTGEATAFMELVAGSSELVSLEKLPISEMPPSDARVDQGPAVAFISGESGDLQRFYYLGAPDNYEVEPFMDGLLMATGQSLVLGAPTSEYIDSLTRDVTIRVFSSPG
jgi:hypothetical protein